MSLRAKAVAVVVVGLSMLGCGATPGAGVEGCEPGSQVPCSCDGGWTGVQVCEGGVTNWSSCQCPGPDIADSRAVDSSIDMHGDTASLADPSDASPELGADADALVSPELEVDVVEACGNGSCGNSENVCSCPQDCDSGCSGCCYDGECREGDTSIECGNGGDDCEDCSVLGMQCIKSKCTCVPKCAGAQCGSDGCGGSCGACPEGQSCQAGGCSVVCGDSQCGAGESVCDCPEDCTGGCSGCCFDSQCQNGDNDAQCGKDGEPCKDCSATAEACIDNDCHCKPTCAGKQCGSDGCGDICGTCPYGSKCDAAGMCLVVCGDEVCGTGEDKCNCPADCAGGCAGCCAGGTCKSGEGDFECGQVGEVCLDCTMTQESCVNHACQCQCGDGMCCSSETCQNCPQDCGDCCGDGMCNFGEDQCSCVTDCGFPCAGKQCGPDGCGGNCGLCPGGESCDQGKCVVICGDKLCGLGEDICNCPNDCVGGCDGCCQAGKCLDGTSEGACGTAGKSCQDCAAMLGVCTDGECSCPCGDGKCCADETCQSCPEDCGECCGNGLCDAGETKCTCQADCGQPCAGKDCGTDGCGGSCGSCAPGFVCEAGKCDDIGLVWVPIPSGVFSMGCSPVDICGSSEKPTHLVSVTAFDMLQTEVTEAQYTAIMLVNPSCDSVGQFGGSQPVECVKLAEAEAFCSVVGGRLPSEAEWEYAARAGTTTKYFCGDDYTCLNGVAWYQSNSGNQKHDVKTLGPNPLGLYDMLGNVKEWVADCWHSSYANAPVSAYPPWDYGCDGSGWWVVRGGSYYNSAGKTTDFLKVSYRDNATNPSTWKSDLVGFRCVR